MLSGCYWMPPVQSWQSRRSPTLRSPVPDTISSLDWTSGDSCQNTRGAPIDIPWALPALDSPGQSERPFGPPPSELHTTARAVAASTSRARQESVPIKKATSAKKTPAKKASLKSVDSAPAKKVAAAQPDAGDEVVLPASPEAVDVAVEAVDLGEAGLVPP